MMSVMWNTHWRKSQHTDEKTEGGYGTMKDRREANIQVNDIPE